MDLAKFISLLVTESLYFACPSEFHDPFEGYYPRSHIEAFSKIVHDILSSLASLKNQLSDQFPGAMDFRKLDDMINNFSLLETSRKARNKFGVSCWHKNEDESAAMWKFYSTSEKSIAIVSTVAQLKDSLEKINGLIIDSVRYVDFDRDPIEKGHKHYGLFLKRKSFEHEKELRATVPLSAEGRGVFVKCNLDALITQIRISPLAPAYFTDAVRVLCSGKIRSLEKPVNPSELFSDPDYGIKIEIKT